MSVVNLYSIRFAVSLFACNVPSELKRDVGVGSKGSYRSGRGRPGKAGYHTCRPKQH